MGGFLINNTQPSYWSKYHLHLITFFYYSENDREIYMSHHREGRILIGFYLLTVMIRIGWFCPRKFHSKNASTKIHIISRCDFKVFEIAFCFQENNDIITK